MDKLLLTGTDTLVGANLAAALRDRWQVATLGGPDAPQIDGCTSIVGQGTDPHETTYHVLSHDPRWIVHCSCLSSSSWDLEQPSIRTAAEAERLATLAEAAARSGAQLCVVSSDAAFCGPRMFHGEMAAATANHAAAEAVRNFERSLLGRAALVVRTHAYGWSPTGTAPCFAERVYAALANGQACAVDAQNYATPILATDLAELISRALEVNLHGVYHMTGAERTNQHRFAAEMAVVFGLTGRKVVLEPPTRTQAIRPFRNETSLNTALARRDLRMPLPMLREGLNRFAEQTVNGHRELLNKDCVASGNASDGYSLAALQTTAA